MNLPAPSDSSAKLGTVRVTKIDNGRVILNDAVVSRSGVTGSSRSAPAIPITIAADQVRQIERERSGGSQAFTFYRNYLTIVLLVGGITGILVTR